MGICNQQHRVQIGLHYNRLNRKMSLYGGYSSLLNINWMYILRQAFISYGELCYATYCIMAFIYVYIICLMFAMYSNAVVTNKIHPPQPLYFSLDNTHPHITSIIGAHQQYINCCYIMVLAWTIGKVKNSGCTKLDSERPSISRFSISNLAAAYFYSMSFLNGMLIIICNTSLLNPGPQQAKSNQNLPKLSIIYHNAEGFIPYGELGKTPSVLNMPKVLGFQSYIFDNNPDIVILNESWLKEDIMDSEIFPNHSYKVFRADRSIKTHPPDPMNAKKYRRNGGGVLIAVKTNLDVESKLLKLNTKAEIISVQLKFPNGTSLCITTCYRVGNLGSDNFSQFSNHMSTVAQAKNTKHILVGDFNLNGTTWPEGQSSCALENDFINLFNDLELNQLITQPTHKDGRTLDLLLCNPPTLVDRHEVLERYQVCNSTHFAIKFSLSLYVKRKKCPKRTVYNFSKADWNGLNDELGKVNWAFHLQSLHPETAWKVFKAILFKLCDKYIPKLTIKSNYKPPWFDSDVFNFCKKKERLRSKYKASQDPKDYTKYQNCRRNLKKVIREKMRSNFEDENDTSLIPKKFWSHVKSTSNSSRIPETVSYNGRFRSNPKDQGELFNKFFFEQFSDPSQYNIDINFQNDTRSEFKISTFGIMKLLKNINTNKAPGPDGIHGKVLKMCSKTIAYPLTLLFNLSFKSGYIPSEWKVANIVPVFKKGDKNKVENYRPISLTCLVMKIFEICIRDELMSACKDKIHSSQHGFLPSKSCTTQMVPFVDTLSVTINEMARTDVIYFDFAKAFDSVSHDIILFKLKHQYKIDGLLLKFLQSYLMDRKQCVVIDGHKSSFLGVLSGVPQGSILGPLLFVLFINDMQDCVDTLTAIALYADDTKIWRRIVHFSDHEALQNDINRLLQWSINNKMKFHPNKCKVLSVTNERKEIIFPFTDVYPYHMGSDVLDYVQSEKDLGVHVTTNLLWNEQCNMLYAKANSRLGLTRRTCHFTKNTQQKRALYLALVRSQFQHCSVIWRPHTTNIKNKLDSLQKRGIKWILSEFSQSYKKQDFIVKQRSLDILPINEHLLLTDLILFHKIFYQLICIPMPDYIQRISVESLNTTTTRLYATARELSDNLLLKCTTIPKKAAFINSFFYRSHLEWNKLDFSLRQVTEPETFKAHLKMHIWANLLTANSIDPILSL